MRSNDSYLCMFVNANLRGAPCDPSNTDKKCLFSVCMFHVNHQKMKIVWDDPYFKKKIGVPCAPYTKQVDGAQLRSMVHHVALYPQGALGRYTDQGGGQGVEKHVTPKNYLRVNKTLAVNKPNTWYAISSLKNT